MNQSQTENNTTQSRQQIAFIRASWHSDIVDVCREAFATQISASEFSGAEITVFDVPGAYEIPLLAKKLAESGKFGVIVASGLVVDGGIYRHEFVANAVIDGMMRVQIDSGVPIISAVLTPHQFHEHGVHQDFFKGHFETKGREAANACIQTLRNMQIVSEMTEAA